MTQDHAERAHDTNDSKKGNTLIFVVLVMICCMLLPHSPAMAQDTISTADTASRPHSIRRAAIYSAVLPGLGQIYNRKAWKVPIIYAGFGVLGYFVYSNNDEFQLYKEAYIYVANDETYPIDNPLVGKYNQDQLQRGMDYYRRNRDLSIIITSLWYVLNILEAYVDAHFFDYDVSEDLSLKISPAATPTFASRPQLAPGLKISLNF